MPFYAYDLFSSEPMPLLVQLGKNKEFIDTVKSLSVTVDKNGNATNAMIAERLSQNKNGYFKRNNERWKVLGKKVMRKKPVSASWVLLGEWSLTHSTMEEEINFWGDRLKARNDWVRTNLHTLESFKFYKPITGYIFLTILLYLTPIAAATIFVAYSFREKNMYTKL